MSGAPSDPDAQTEQPEEREPSRLEQWIRSERVRGAVVCLIPLLYYAITTPLEFTYGDGPELLTAAYKLGGPHPSGYPLFTLLGHLPAHFPWATPFWNVSFVCSAIPSALATLAIYLTLRRLETFWPIAITVAWAWAANTHVVYQATRVEVYSLHCMFIAFAFFAMTSYATGGGKRWAYLAVASVCLGMTNHLTTVFLSVPLVLGLLLVDRKQILRVSTLAKMAGIAVAAASIYAFVPIQALLNEGNYISWNNPDSLERFWFHVTGSEYSIFRRTDQMASTAMRFFISIENTFFPGLLIVSLIGVYEWAVRRWKPLIVIILFQVSSILYMATYPIRDISTYYTALYIAPILFFGLGLDWLYRKRFRQHSQVEELLATVFVTVLFGWNVSMYVDSHRNYYKEALAEDMSEQVMAGMDGPALIFTSIDGHTFPLWYQVYVEHPDRQVVVVDTVMFHLRNKDWYRGFLREHYPWVKWPSDEIALGNRWKQWIVDNNPDLNIYALLARPWNQRGSYPQIVGWHHRIIDGKPERGEASRVTRHIYTSRHLQMGRTDYFYDSELVYESGIQDVGCVVEWFQHQGVTGTWKFVGPDGREVTFKPHPVPGGSSLSWEFLEVEKQTPGQWRCEVEVPGEPPLVSEFQLVE